MTAVRPFASRLSRLWPALLLWFALATAGQARTVATIEELHAALASARGGETILLAPGRYERLSIGPRSGYDPSFPATVTVASADPGNPAAIGRMTLDGVANLTLQNLLFDYRFDPAHTHRERAFQILNSRNVAILDSELRGDIARNVSEKADGFGWGIGLGIRHSSGVRIERNTFHLWHRAMVVGRSQDVLVRENEIHSVRSDGMNFASVQRVLIEGNHIHSFRTSRTSGDHPDMIQFWTAGTERPTTDVVIRNNILNAGRGSFSQSIFMRNEVVDSGRAGREMFYRNIEIAGNVIINSHLHGITVGETEGLVIRNNTMLRSPYTATPPREGNIRFPTIRLKAASERV
ncbi:MAG: right-handed parallel beta-helix repeat-containing protein, partial [Gemmobacter sp.]